jgi:hypothetical protein
MDLYGQYSVSLVCMCMCMTDTDISGPLRGHDGGESGVSPCDCCCMLMIGSQYQCIVLCGGRLSSGVAHVVKGICGQASGDSATAYSPVQLEVQSTQAIKTPSVHRGSCTAEVKV